MTVFSANFGNAADDYGTFRAGLPDTILALRFIADTFRKSDNRTLY